ncbi:crossover junction endodeoxyribonuclease RuvC [Acinetobacter baumannii 24812_7]|nr:crossover junction endodeoxyribonuclease RuvC [Acinetobacter baumannii 24812_7]
MPLIIGIDPGSRLTGYGIIEKDGSKLRFVDAGTIRTETQEMPERLKRIFAGVERIVKFHGPTEAAVEQVFMAQNPDSALKLGQARGAAIAALVNLDLQVAEYTARQIKQSVVGYGAADKEQVQMMVMRLLNLTIKPSSRCSRCSCCCNLSCPRFRKYEQTNRLECLRWYGSWTKSL